MPRGLHLGLPKLGVMTIEEFRNELQIHVRFNLVLALSSSASAENWPGFRGPTGMGISTETGLPVTWGADGNGVIWKAPLPATLLDAKSDHNQSSPIVWQDRVFVTTAFWPTKQTEDIPEQHVTCYRTADGKQLWDTQVPAGPWKLTDLRGGYAAPTPVTDGERVYVLFGSSILAALDWEGEIVWHKEVPDWQAFDVAIASSPILFQNSLLVLADRNQRKSTLTAYNPKTGDVLWEQKRPDQAFAHTTPVITQFNGQIPVARSCVQRTAMRLIRPVASDCGGARRPAMSHRPYPPTVSSTPIAAAAAPVFSSMRAAKAT